MPRCTQLLAPGRWGSSDPGPPTCQAADFVQVPQISSVEAVSVRELWLGDQEVVDRINQGSIRRLQRKQASKRVNSRSLKEDSELWGPFLV